MDINLRDLTYLSDLDLFKIIISSADRFPGLYRISSTWQQTLQSDTYLKLFNFLETIFRTEAGYSWTREDWFKAHRHIFELAYGKGSRNEERKDADLRLMLKERGFKWFNDPKSFDLVLIDNATPVNEILPDKSYYMMGSILHFKEDRCLISYNDLDGTFAQSLNVSYGVAKNYIDSVFSEKSLNDLFLQSEIIARLSFDESDEGELKYDMNKVNNLLLTYPGNCPIFAAANYKEILPIRFAKLIGVSNVCK